MHSAKITATFRLFYAHVSSISPSSIHLTTINIFQSLRMGERLFSARMPNI
jgi:hypothetical protein